MIAMAIKAISVAGMGRSFMDEKEVDKLAAVYDVVRLLYVYGMLLDNIKEKKSYQLNFVFRSDLTL